MHEFLKLIPKPIATALAILVATSVALFLVSQILEMAYEPIAKRRTVAEEDVRTAERRLQLERIKIEQESLMIRDMEQRNLETKMDQAKLEANRQSLNLPPVSATTGPGALDQLVSVATKHLSTIMAIMFAAILLPAFVNTNEPWRLALMISAGITLAGAFALVQGSLSPTTAAVKVDVFSLSLSSTSIAVALASIGAVLTGVCIFMTHRPQMRGDTGQQSPGSPTNG